MVAWLICGFIFGLIIGERRGWRQGIAIARQWEQVVYDYKLQVKLAEAETEADERAAYEVRELERMMYADEK